MRSRERKSGVWSGQLARQLLLAVFVAGIATVGSGQAVQPMVTPGASLSGGLLHGVIKSGAVPLPGVTVTATNTLTGKKFATVSDITGAWSMAISQNGRYVLRTEFAAFAAATHEALLNASSHEQVVNFELTLASRVAKQDAQEEQGQQQCQ